MSVISRDSTASETGSLAQWAHAHTLPTNRFIGHPLWPTSLSVSPHQPPPFLYTSLPASVLSCPVAVSQPLCPVGSVWKLASGFSYHMVKAGNRLDKHSPFLLTYPHCPPLATKHAHTYALATTRTLHTHALSINEAAVCKMTRFSLASLLLSFFSHSLDPPPPHPLLSSFLPGLKSQPQTHGPASPHLSVITHTASQLQRAVLHLGTKV